MSQFIGWQVQLEPESALLCAQYNFTRLLFTTLIGLLSPALVWFFMYAACCMEYTYKTAYSRPTWCTGIIFGTVFWDRGHSTCAPPWNYCTLPLEHYFLVPHKFMHQLHMEHDRSMSHAVQVHAAGCI